MKLPRPPRKPRTDVDMVPMINVAFLLLIFFVLTGAQNPARLAQITPPHSSAAAPDHADADAVQIAADGRASFEDAALTDAELVPRIARWRAEHPDVPLQVQADARADAARVVGLLQSLRATGVSDVSLLVQRSPPP
ncbi:MAG: ExbD/TolR family protein [Stenotrophobium sp.]